MQYIPYSRQHIDAKDIKEVLKVLQSDWLTQGPKIAAFEASIAKRVGARFAAAVCNGTCALHLAYRVAGIGNNDEIITTPNTFVATANAALFLGAKLLFGDIELSTYNLDPATIEKLITPRTKAIVPVHFAGHPSPMDEIIAIAQKHRIKIIEDAAHALGATYKNKPIGSLLTDMTVFSFHPVKPITAGEGGVVVTNNKNYYKKVLLLRSHGVQKNSRGFNVMNELGYNYRMTDIQAALGFSQLNKLTLFTKKREQITVWYKQELANCPDIILPQEQDQCSSSFHLYVIRVKKIKDRDILYQHLQNHRIGVNFHYPSVYSHPFYRKNGYGNTIRPCADLYAKSAITLPLYPDLTREKVYYIARVIKNFFNA